MSLNKQDRIELSAKMAGAAEEKSAVDKTIEIVDQAKLKAEAKDSPNKKLVDEKTALINPYQNELKLLDGTVRTELTESVLLDSAKRVLGNSFFPNKPNAPLPSIPGGVWLNFSPFSRTHAIGKTSLEVYESTGNRGEQIILTDITSKILSIEAKIIATRATGKKGQTTGSCTPAGSGTTQSVCIANGGTWTPGPDVFVSDTDTQGFLSDLKALVQEWENTLNNQKSIINSISDSNSVRKTQNLAALTDINNSLTIINNWQAVQDYDTTTPLPSTIASFNALTESYFQQTKMQPTTLQILKNELTARSAYVVTRKDQLSGGNYLGSITQDMSTGSITAIQGLYGERMLFIDMRINAVGGTLSEVVAFSMSKTSQNEIKKSIEIATQGIGLVMKATKAAAPGIDTKFMNFESLSGFSVGDRVYLVADDQEELSGSIEEINGNRAKLTFSVPKKYTTSNNTRIYKLL
jgi:hypothetical protein